MLEQVSAAPKERVCLEAGGADASTEAASTSVARFDDTTEDARTNPVPLSAGKLPIGGGIVRPSDVQNCVSGGQRLEERLSEIGRRQDVFANQLHEVRRNTLELLPDELGAVLAQQIAPIRTMLEQVSAAPKERVCLEAGGADASTEAASTSVARFDDTTEDARTNPVPLSAGKLPIGGGIIKPSDVQNCVSGDGSTTECREAHVDIAEPEERGTGINTAMRRSRSGLDTINVSVAMDRLQDPSVSRGRASCRTSGYRQALRCKKEDSEVMKRNWYNLTIERTIRKSSSAMIFSTAISSMPNTRLARFIDSPWFSIICAVSIVCNTTFVAVDTDLQMKSLYTNQPQETQQLFQQISRVFTVYFTLELLLRILALRFWFFVGHEWKWNVFDLFLVFSSIVNDTVEGYNISFMRVLRILRMVKVMRLIRVLRFFRELRKMMFSILACMTSLMWALMLLFLIMFLFSILFLQGAIGFLEEKGNFDAHHADFERWYPSLYSTMFSLVLVITGGTDWLEVVRPLREIHWAYELLFTFYILFVIFGVVNVLTGVFLESAAEFVDRDLIVHSQLVQTEGFVAEMQKLFEEFDSERSGFVDTTTLLENLQSEKVQAYLAAHNLDCYDSATLIRLIDLNHDDRVDLEEFISGMLRLRGVAKNVDLKLLEMNLNRMSVKDLERAGSTVALSHTDWATSHE